MIRSPGLEVKPVSTILTILLQIRTR